MRPGKTAKNLVKKILSGVRGKDIGALPESVIAGVDIISFDVFDTLVQRTVDKPSDVFDIVAGKSNISDFKAQRMLAEKRARERVGSSEIRLIDIYGELNSIYKDCDWLMLLEIESELEVCRADEKMKAFYERAKDLGKRIVITSDMYLPSEVIGVILKKCGYEGYEKLFVSSEYGVMKRDGRLYDVVKKACEVSDGSCILHIGDHPLADYTAAKKMGLHSFLYRMET